MNILINSAETKKGMLVFVDVFDDFVPETSSLRKEASDLHNEAIRLAIDTHHCASPLWPMHCTAGIPDGELETHFNGLVSKLPTESFIPEEIKELFEQDISLDLLPGITGMALDHPVLENTLKLISGSECMLPLINL